jgi:SAM-dependent methyltransferase
MARLDELLPRCGTILDLGCGHGLVALMLALASDQRRLLGVDTDPTKVAAASSAASSAGLGDRLRFDTVGRGWHPQPGSVDAVVIADVVYLLPPEERAGLLCAAVAAAPGGVVVVKEMADRPVWKRRLTELQEQVSVRVTRITEGATVQLATEDELRAPLAAAGAQVERHDLSARRLHPHVAFVARPTGSPVTSVDETSGRRWGG